MEMCYTITNRLKIHPVGMATLKKRFRRKTVFSKYVLKWINDCSVLCVYINESISTYLYFKLWDMSTSIPLPKGVRPRGWCMYNIRDPSSKPQQINKFDVGIDQYSHYRYRPFGYRHVESTIPFTKSVQILTRPDFGRS